MTDNLLTINIENEYEKSRLIDALPIYNEHYPLLRVKIPEYIGEFSNVELIRNIERLKYTRKKYNAIGLSANQCGIVGRYFVIGTDTIDIVCINPRVIEYSDTFKREPEGCISFPGLYFYVNRNDWIEVEFYDINGQMIRTRFEGITARAFLHELDHLNGILFTDKIGDVALKMARKKQKKLNRRKR